ncbi:MAG: hypothetical protein U1E17_07910 [Geminicoccaceae bacterium]
MPGDYTVNVHLYRNRAQRADVPVTVVVSVRSSPTCRPGEVLMSKVTALAREGEERTVFRFNLNEAGAVVPGTVNQRCKKALRSGTKS